MESEGNMESVKAKLFIEHVKKTKAKNTIKSYMGSITKFIEFEKKTLDQILEERRQDIASGDFMRSMHFSRELEAFHKNLSDRGFTINSARNYCIGIKQFFKFYGFPLQNLSQEISKTVLTTKDFVPTIQEYRNMFNAHNKALNNDNLTLVEIRSYIFEVTANIPELIYKEDVAAKLNHLRKLI